MVSYKGELFSVHFPHHLYDSVLECLNCKYFGKWNGCIIMQCANCCSENEPDEMPICYGAIDIGVEAFPNHKNSPSSTYLKGVDWTTLGDVFLENTVELCAHLPKIDVVAINNRMYLFNRSSVPYTFHEISNNEIEQMQDYEMASLCDYEKQESDIEPFDGTDGLLPGCCDSTYDMFNSETFPDLFKPKKNVHFENDSIIKTKCEITKQNNDLSCDDLSDDDLPPLIPSENSQYINKLQDNRTVEPIHPLSEVMEWAEVMEAFTDWKKFRGIKTEESCMDWAKYIKKEWAKDMERTGEHYPEVVIPEEDNETSQATDLHNQTGIFDWTPTNRRDRIESLMSMKYSQCDDFDC
jgi:hypothetical protein